MTINTTISTTRFSRFDDKAIDFYQTHGWVLINNAFTPAECQQLKDAWDQMVTRHADNIGCERQKYLQVICQWRDLWQQQAAFAQVLQSPLSKLASQSFGLPGCRLLHDHLISKSIDGCNGEIPWHQDSMYWPVDRTGMSTWTALQDTPVTHGCLEVVDRSHQWGGSEPIDFMQDPGALPQEGSKCLIPALEGDVVMLHSRTWHRSAASTSQGTTRMAHIALWLAQNTCFWPQNAAWHPVNAQVSVRPGQVLNDDEFPLFGEKVTATGNTQLNKHASPAPNKGMFNAKKRVTAQVQTILMQQGNLGDLLSSPENRNQLVDALLSKNDDVDPSQARSVIDALWISAAAYEGQRSRNVFSSNYQQWEALYGK